MSVRPVWVGRAISISIPCRELSGISMDSSDTQTLPLRFDTTTYMLEYLNEGFQWKIELTQ